MGYDGAWSGRLAYARRRPAGRPVVAGHDGRNEAIQPNAADMIDAPERQGPGAPELVQGDEVTEAPRGGGWRGAWETSRHDVGYVGDGYAKHGTVRRRAHAAHAVDQGAVDDVTTERPAMLQTDRTVAWRGNQRVKPLGHGSEAAIGRGLNGLDKNNDPAAQHYAINQVGNHRVDRKFPGARIWTRYLTPLRMRVAAQAVVSRPSEASPATSWAPTATSARNGRSTVPMLRRLPRDWTESRTLDDQAVADGGGDVPSWGL